MNGAGVHLPAGARLGSGRYVIDGILGQGGFGITYRATDAQLDRPVAIKEFFLAGSLRIDGKVVPPTGIAADFEERRSRVLEEARALARFRHSGIVTVHEYLEENDTVYVVMELLAGRTLRSVLVAAQGPLPEDRALHYASQIAAALDAVHAEQLLHRDVKPDNVIVLDDDHVVLVDFGTAREFALGQSSLMSQTLTPGYAPVEQYTAHGRFGPATDVYALGATVYHLLTGRAPVPSLDRFTGTPLPSPRELNPAVSQAASDAVMWAMAIEAADRPQSAGAFAAAVRGAAAAGPASGATTRIVTPSGGLHPTLAGATRGGPGTVGAGTASGAVQPVRVSRRRRAVRRGVRRMGRLVVNLVITIVIGVVATFAVMWFLERDSEPTPVPLPAPTVAVADAPATAWQPPGPA